MVERTAFLRQSEDTWPINKPFEKPIGDNELKRSVYAGNDSRPQEPREDEEACHTFVALTECLAFPLVPTNYSSWLKLRRIQAWINRFVESKKISNDQELIQSDPISCPQNQKGNN